MASVNRRKGVILDTDTQEDTLAISADVPLNEMFGYSTELRSLTQGKGEFSMEYRTHLPVTGGVQAELLLEHQKALAASAK